MMNQRGALPLIIILAGIVLAAAAVGIGVATRSGGNSAQNSAPVTPTAPTSSPVSENDNSNLLLTMFDPTLPSEESIKRDPELKGTTILSDGSTQYTLSSANVVRDNIYIFKNQKLVFMRQLASTTNNNPSLSTYDSQLGNPDRVLTGSNYYGAFIQIRVYAQKGYEVTTNPFTDEVYEFQRFDPLSVEDYLSKWGSDYNPDAKLL